MLTRNAYRLPFTLFGIPVYLHATLILILPLMAWMISRNIREVAGYMNVVPRSGMLVAGITPYLLGLLAAVGLFLSVLLHELGHALTARHYGVRTRSITLWLLGGIAQFEEMSRQRGAEAIIALAGPVVSFLLGGAFLYAWPLIPLHWPALGFIVAYLAWINFMLGGFNLMPALPLDGGRILRSLLALRLTYLRATRLAASISKALAIAMGLAGFFLWQPFLIFIAFFVYIMVTAETRQAVMAEALEGVRVDEVMTRDIKTVPPELTVTELKELMLQERLVGFPVTNGSVVGVVTLHNIRGAAPDATVQDIMSRDYKTIRYDRPAMDAFRLMSRDNYRRVIVTDDSGQMVGILTKIDLIRAMQIRELLADDESEP